MSEELRAEEYSVHTEMEGSWQLRVTSYRLGEKYLCSVDNVDPGATLARAEGASREEAEAAALEKARRRVRATRVIEQ